MNSIYLRGHVDRQNGKGSLGDPIWFVATTEGVKADGLNLKMDRAQLDRFRANPIIGYGHRFGGRDNLPIGRADDIKIEEPALRLKVGFDQGDEFATTVERKIRDGYLNAMSVGFDVWNVDKQTGIPEGWELFEASIVPIPLDPDALSEVGRAAVDDLEDMLTTARSVFPDAGSRSANTVDRTPIQPHSTATVDSSWDGPKAVAAAPNDASVLRHMHAWRDPDGDPEAKQTYKFPHHAPGSDTAANLAGVRNALARLPQSNIPDGDRAGVERHLRRHLEDAENTQAAPEKPRLHLAEKRLRLVGS